jgi:hypothetical protein
MRKPRKAKGYRVHNLRNAHVLPADVATKFLLPIYQEAVRADPTLPEKLRAVAVTDSRQDVALGPHPDSSADRN